MDPDEALDMIRTSMLVMEREDMGTDAYLAACEAARTAFQDLDGWLARGGFLPAAWMPFRPPVPPQRH